MRKLCLNNTKQFLADGKPEIDKLGTVFFSGIRPECVLYAGKFFHSFRIKIHKLGNRNVRKGYHGPNRICKIVRPPPKFIGIIKAVGHKRTFRSACFYGFFKGFMVANRLADIIDFMGFKGKDFQNFPCIDSPLYRMIFMSPLNVMEKAGTLDDDDPLVDKIVGASGKLILNNH